MFSPHLTHSCTHRYFAIALLNKEGSVLKMGGTTKLQNLTVVYQIHRDGKIISSVFIVYGQIRVNSIVLIWPYIWLWLYF